MLETIQTQRRLDEAGRRLREDRLAISTTLARSFVTVDAFRRPCGEWAQQLEHMMSDEVLTAEEIDRCKSMFDHFEREITGAREREASGSAVSLLRTVVGRTDHLVGETNYVTAVNTSLLGDHVRKVHKKTFCYVDEEQFSNLVFELNELTDHVDENESDSTGSFPARICEIARLAGWAHKLVEPGVLRHCTPKIVEELRDRLGELGSIFESSQVTGELQTFESFVAQARRGLSVLHDDQRKAGEPIRLRGWFMQKLSAKDVERFAEFLRARSQE